jgi:hypothetical protein
MKTLRFLSSFAALTLALPAVAQSQSSSVSDSGSASATARQQGATSGSATSTSAGMAFHNGRPYIIRDTQATRFDDSVVQAGKMMTDDGRVVDIPEGIAGMTAKVSNVVDGGSSSATARQQGAISGSQTGANTQDGWILQDGVLYRVDNGRATRVEASAIPSGQMMGVEGRMTPMPEGVRFDAGERRSSDATNRNNDDQNRNASSQRDRERKQQQ